MLGECSAKWKVGGWEGGLLPDREMDMEVGG